MKMCLNCNFPILILQHINPTRNKLSLVAKCTAIMDTVLKDGGSLNFI